MLQDHSVLTLCLIACSQHIQDDDFFSVVHEAVRGGVTLVQLCGNDLNAGVFLKKANQCKQITDKYHVPLVIRRRMDIAFDAKAAGVYMGRHDIAIRDTRRIMRNEKIVGASASTPDLAKAAAQAGADYLCVGPVCFHSVYPEKNTISLSILKQITQSVPLPVVASGGITPENAFLLKGTGIQGIAVSSAIFCSRRPLAAAAALRSLADQILLS